jgi:very-short-patch-repair endonuclease
MITNKASQRADDNFFNATELLNIYNTNNRIQKSISEFWSNKSTKQIYNNLLLKLKLPYLHEAKRGKGGCTWMQEDLFLVFYNWLNKIPNQSITRDELEFCSYIEESFFDILYFERQKKFENYYVDLYCDEIKLCIEFDEEFHKKRIEIDNERQEFIEEKYEVFFIRHKPNERYSKTINKIIKYKQSYNLVKCIKNNKVPTIGFL